jgi:hypothetical protein
MLVMPRTLQAGLLSLPDGGQYRQEFHGIGVVGKSNFPELYVLWQLPSWRDT